MAQDNGEHWQVRHNPLFKPKVIPDEKKKKDKEKCRKFLTEK